MKPRHTKLHARRQGLAQRKRFYVDHEMCGGELFLEDFDLIEFCQVLQRVVPELRIIPVLDPTEHAHNPHPELLDPTAFETAMGQYVHT